MQMRGEVREKSSWSGFLERKDKNWKRIRIGKNENVLACRCFAGDPGRFSSYVDSSSGQ